MKSVTTSVALSFFHVAHLLEVHAPGLDVLVGVESGAEDPGSRRVLWICSRCCSDRSNFGEPLDCVLVVPADSGFPCGPRLRGDVVRLVVETGSVVGHHQVEVGDVDVRLIPVDQRDPISGHANVARVGVAVDDAGLTSD